MIDQPPQIPPAVVQFAEDNGYRVIEQNEFWTKKYPYKGYKYVYNVEPINKIDDDIPCSDIILMKGKKIRFATFEEALEIVQVYY